MCMGCVTPDQLKCKVPRSAQIFIFRGVGFDFRSTQIQNPECQDLPKFSFSGGGGPDQLKSKVPRSVQIFILRMGGTPDQHS